MTESGLAPQGGRPGRVRGAFAGIGVALLAVLAGVLVGSIGAFVQATRDVWQIGTTVIAVPWGLVVMLILVVCTVRGSALLLGTRGGGWAALAGWLGATVLFAVDSPSGDVAISAGGRQVLYVIGGTILGAATSTFPVGPRLRRAPLMPPE